MLKAGIGMILFGMLLGKHPIINMDWAAAKQDILRFLRPRDIPTLELWSRDFFAWRLEKLAEYCR